MVALLPPDDVDRAVRTLADHQIPAWVAGEARLDEHEGGHVALTGQHPGW
jgi:phosphoribosylformylglycinamidine cyclo-ligase